VRDQYGWVPKEGTAIVRDPSGTTRWWTFAGLRSNSGLAAVLGPLSGGADRAENLSIPLDSGADVEKLRERLSSTQDFESIEIPVDEDALKAMKFSDCLPLALAKRVISTRMVDEGHIRTCINEPIRAATL